MIALSFSIAIGDVGASMGGPDGLFHADTRHLSRLELSLNEFQPLLLGSNISDDNAILTVDLTNPADRVKTLVDRIPSAHALY